MLEGSGLSGRRFPFLGEIAGEARVGLPDRPGLRVHRGRLGIGRLLELSLCCTNELLFAGFFIRSEAYWTLPRGLSGMVTGDIFPYGRMFAASLMMALPISVAAAIGQRAMVSGLTAGAVKG